MTSLKVAKHPIAHQSAGDEPLHGPALQHAHKLLELADRYRVHVESGFRRELLQLQDSILAAMRKAGERDPD